jgi:hypothetical protein
MDFVEAMACIKANDAIRRKTWEETAPSTFVGLHDGTLMIYTNNPKKNGELDWLGWIISESDVYAHDWEIFPLGED